MFLRARQEFSGIWGLERQTPTHQQRILARPRKMLARSRMNIAQENPGGGCPGCDPSLQNPRTSARESRTVARRFPELPNCVVANSRMNLARSQRNLSRKAGIFKNLRIRIAKMDSRASARESHTRAHGSCAIAQDSRKRAHESRAIVRDSRTIANDPRAPAQENPDDGNPDPAHQNRILAHPRMNLAHPRNDFARFQTGFSHSRRRF